MYEIALVKALFDKDKYTAFRNAVDESTFSKETKPLLKALDDWYAHNARSIDLDNFSNVLFSCNKPTDYLKSSLVQIQAFGGAETTEELLHGLKQNQTLEQIMVTASDLIDGRKPRHDLKSLVEAIYRPVETTSPFLATDLASLLETAVKRPGLRWRLKSLNRAVGSLRQGDLAGIFARVETGKTTFLMDNLTYMASQLSDDSGPIIIFNGEEQGQKVLLRGYQAALGKTIAQLITDLKGNQDAYRRITKDKILVIDNPSIPKALVEKVCANEKPSLVAFDTLDKVSGFSADRYDLELGERYQWARELAKTYAPVLALSQADGTADGLQWLSLANMANSKTSKAAELDLAIGIGVRRDSGFDFHRYLAICKNKLIGDEDTDPNLRHTGITTLIRPPICRYEDL